jgi:hypothetical protein
LNAIDEESGKVWYVDDSWVVNLKNGDTNKETYVVDKEDYISNAGKVAGFVAPSAESILMLEVRG